MPIAASSAQPWRSLPIMRPKVFVSPAPMAKISSISTQVRRRRRILEGMRGIDVEKPAAVRAQHLDRDLRCDRSARDQLLSAFERRYPDRAVEGLGHALPYEEQGGRNGDRQQHVEQRPGHIDPKIADRMAVPAREAAHQGDPDGDTGGGGEKRLNGDPCHLAQVAEGGFPRIGLPARVRGKAYRRVQRQIGATAGKLCG